MPSPFKAVETIFNVNQHRHLPGSTNGFTMGEDVAGDTKAGETNGQIRANKDNNNGSRSRPADNEWHEYHGKLLRMIKKEVKQIMEEAVTRKFVHEDSGSIVSLCGAVDACLSHGLKRRALGLFKTNSTTALLQKVAKNCDSAARIYRMVVEIERSLTQRSSSSDSQNRQRNLSTSAQNALPSIRCTRYLWIRLALIEKQLFFIVEHLVQNASLYYEREALVADQVCGQLLASLLVGPCALDYSRMKTQDQLWHDLPADELVQRHYLVSGPPTPLTPPVTRRAPLYLPQQRRHVNSLGSSQPSDSSNASSGLSSLDQSTSISTRIQSAGNHYSSSISSLPSSAVSSESPLARSWSQKTCGPFSPKEYVESLHQNCRSTLLYGKNNVWVQSKEDSDTLPGYLSLHQTQCGLEIRWTPNQLMSSSSDENNDKSLYWNYALNIKVDEVVYLHCHQEENGGVIVFVGQDGVQRSPIRFPKGTHLLAFLTCLESGLQPNGQLDPPLCLQKGKGKVFPQLKKRTRATPRLSKVDAPESESAGECVRMDYVFRIVTSFDKPDIISEEMFNPKAVASNAVVHNSRPHLARSKLTSTSSSGSSGSSSSGSRSEDFMVNPAAELLQKLRQKKPSHARPSVSSATSSSEAGGLSPIRKQSAPVINGVEQPIQNVCESMKKQIVARAFHGWLAYCRHLRTVRTHLSALVQPAISRPGSAESANFPSMSSDNASNSTAPLSSSDWLQFQDANGRITKLEQVLQQVYMSGCEHRLRPEVWPFLLGHYAFESTRDEREEQRRMDAQSYELLMSEWLAVEAIVKQRDKESVAASLAKLSSGSSASKDDRDPTLANEVFTDSESEIGDIAEDTATESSSEQSKDKPDQADKEIISSNQILVTNPSVDTGPPTQLLEAKRKSNRATYSAIESTVDSHLLPNIEEREGGQLSTGNSACVSPASSNGGVYSNELLDLFSLNLHRIDKDVQRCDRNYSFFANTANLEKLRNVMCTYVWQNLQQGYVQGMCDLVAPFLVIFDDEPLSYFCFCELMKRMSANFPYGGAMDTHFANMRSLIQILDPELFELMHSNGDYTHFYFCYRWFLLDFKREFCYDDVFKVWEMIWSGQNIASSHLVLFVALALVQQYRDIVLENNMDFTDVIKFFNEMAERHDANAILKNARDLVYRIQQLIC